MQQALGGALKGLWSRDGALKMCSECAQVHRGRVVKD